MSKPSFEQAKGAKAKAVSASEKLWRYEDELLKMARLLRMDLRFNPFSLRGEGRMGFCSGLVSRVGKDAVGLGGGNGSLGRRCARRARGDDSRERAPGDVGAGTYRIDSIRSPAVPIPSRDARAIASRPVTRR